MANHSLATVVNNVNIIFMWYCSDVVVLFCVIYLGSKRHKYVRPVAPAGTRGCRYYVRDRSGNGQEIRKVHHSARLV